MASPGTYCIDDLPCDDFVLPVDNTPVSGKSCARIAIAVAAVAGIALIAVAACLFSFGSGAFLGLIIPGLFLTAVSAAGLIGTAIGSCDQKRKEATQLHEEALAFANEELQRCSFDSIPYHSDPLSSLIEISQPRDPNIGKLHTLRLSLLHNLYEVLDQAQGPVWSDPAVIEALDKLLKVDYAIGYYTLEDLPTFLNAQHRTGFQKEDVLTASDCYPHQAFPSLLVDYRLIRSEPTPEFQFASPSQSNNKAHSSLFYQPGTPQYNWRILYNHYCKSLPRLPAPYKQWTIPDTSQKAFLPRPKIDLPWPWNLLGA